MKGQFIEEWVLEYVRISLTRYSGYWWEKEGLLSLNIESPILSQGNIVDTVRVPFKPDHFVICETLLVFAFCQTPSRKTRVSPPYTTMLVLIIVIRNNARSFVPSQPIIIKNVIVVVAFFLVLLVRGFRAPTRLAHCHWDSRWRDALRPLLLAVLLSYRIAGIDPIGIDVDSGGEIFFQDRVLADDARRSVGGRRELTIDGALELLVADLAGELADAGFLVELDGDGLLVVAEEAREDRSQGLVLQRCC